MEESVRSTLPVTEALPHIDLHAIPHPAKRVVRAAEAAAPVETHSPSTPSTAWEAHYRAWVIGSDVFATVLVIAVAAAIIDRFAPHDMHAIGTAAAVLCALPASRAWSQRVLGEGAEEAESGFSGHETRLLETVRHRGVEILSQQPHHVAPRETALGLR